MRPEITPESIALNNDVFTRTELAALTACVNGMTVDQISNRYLSMTALGMKDLLRRATSLLHAYDLLFKSAALRKGPNQDAESRPLALAAIKDIERLGPAKLQLHQPLSAWFIRHLSDRLEQAGIITIFDLLTRMNEDGPAWWRKIPRFGRKTGMSMLSWAKRHCKDLNFELKDFIKHPTLYLEPQGETVLIFPKTTELAPLERMRISQGLSGATGTNRADLTLCRLHAINDYEAIRTWLSLYPENTHTFRAYRRESERFLLWCVQHKGKAMSDVFVEDIIEYRDFLKDPQPRFTWVGATTTRFSRDWRPFQGPLSHTSQAHSITILKSMFEFLRKQNYLSSNPFSALPKNSVPTRIAVEKALSIDAWKSVYEWGLKQKRDTFITALAFLTLMRDAGLRRTEVTHLLRSNLTFNNGWKATFMGKGSRVRTVPLSDNAIKAIEAHLKTRKQSLATIKESDPLIKPKTYLVANKDLEKENFGYTEQGLWRIIKQFFKAYAKDNGDFEGRDLSSITPHALRHTFGVNALELGVPIDVVQQTLGHASLSTTTIYSQGDIKRRTKELEKLFNS